MNGLKTTLECERFSGARHGYTCPDCGSTMIEVEQSDENGFVFIWYKCVEIDCEGHWLEKRFAAIRDF
jgi:hypothetical protein